MKHRKEVCNDEMYFTWKEVTLYLIESDCFVEFTGADGVKETKSPDSIHIGRVLTQLKRTLRV